MCSAGSLGEPLKLPGGLTGVEQTGWTKRSGAKIGAEVLKEIGDRIADVGRHLMASRESQNGGGEGR